MNNSSDPHMENRTMPPCTIIPVLVYPDVAGAIEWLSQMFGFRERWRAGNHRAQLSFGGSTIAISEPRTRPQDVSDQAPGLQPAVATGGSKDVTLHSLMVRVPDVQRHYEHARKNGVRIIQTPADFPYGERQYTAEDPGGHRWTFSQSIADVAPEDWGGTTAVHKQDIL